MPPSVTWLQKEEAGNARLRKVTTPVLTMYLFAENALLF